MAFQGSLLDQATEPAVGELGPCLRRTVLDHAAWVDLQRGWITGADALFAALLPPGEVRSDRSGRDDPSAPPARRPHGPDKPAAADAAGVGWRAERRWMYERVVDVPRLVCHYEEHQELPHPVLAAAMAALNRHYQDELNEPSRFEPSSVEPLWFEPPWFEPLCTAGLCLYRDGRDSVAWHGDNSGRAVPRTVVAILSLGTPRALLLRPLAGGRTLRYDLGHGDLLVMGGTCQRTWQHAIPKTARATGPRISVQFRARGIR